MQVFQSTTCQRTGELGQLERLLQALLGPHFPQNPDIDLVIRALLHTLNLTLAVILHNTAGEGARRVARGEG